MAAVFASCQKAEVSEPASNDFQLNITVADLGTSDELATKAMIKTLWTKGNVIQIWYDSNSGSDPNLEIKYDGTKWEMNADYNGNSTPSAGEGKIKALYFGQVRAASKDSYIFKNNTLTFNISNWNFLTEIQVVVTGITGNASDYYLACDKFAPFNNYTVAADTITAIAGSKGDAATGFESEVNPGCATFVFATADYTTGDATDTYKFTLKNNNDNYTEVYYTPAAKSFPKDTKCIKGIKMAKKSFTTGKTNGHYWAQLWEDGPCWATTNIGASNSSDYGYYFAWGYTAGYVRYYNYWALNNNYSNTTQFNSTYFSNYNPEGNVLDAGHDAATQNWSADWRMPTSAELMTLINMDSSNKCTVEYDNNDNIIIITGKGDYSANSISFRVSGYGTGSDLSGYGDYGYCWSSTQRESDKAYYLYFSFSPDNKSTYVLSSSKHYGYPVRPVRSFL